ncbi:hypothetical protein DWZ83_10585 [Amedibacillus dolichus]|uniref:DUF3592 domain-containing protein n=1 Tax=Amedibacillus dolichus TaxID=31971 RepID=A0A415NXS3_9FIRM|nr:DUF3592 domain-containing protein [Amedibacillus dolichus]RHM05307.1 hypothetical protein DWZ83_10585 [Amedibacillus dolichus]
MAILVHILTILFGFVTFVIIKNKRYKDVPLVSSIMIFSFVGFGMISVITIFVPSGKLLVFPLGCIIFGLIIILMLINDVYSLVRCNEKINGVYCGYNTYYGGNGVSTQAPVFEYTYQGHVYKEQTTQNISYKQLTKKMREGETYQIYVDSKHPAVFILQKKIKMSSIVVAFFGILFLVGGIVTLYDAFPYFLKITLYDAFPYFLKIMN